MFCQDFPSIPHQDLLQIGKKQQSSHFVELKGIILAHTQVNK